MPSASAKFNLVTQLSEGFLDRVVKRLYSTGAFPIEYAGQLRRRSDRYAIAMTLSYAARLGEPTFYLDTATPGGLGLRGQIEGSLRVDGVIEPRGGEPGGSHAWVVPIQAAFDVVAVAEIVPDDDLSYLQIRLEDIVDLDLALSGNGGTLPHKDLIQAVIKRVLLVELRKRVQRIPISHLFQSALFGGWDLDTPTLRIIDGPPPADADNVTIAMNTWPNRRRGRPLELCDFVNPVHDFGIAVDQRLIRQTLDNAWRTPGVIARRYNDEGRPDPRGANVLDSIDFDLRDGRATFSVAAHRESDLLPDAHIVLHGEVGLNVNDGYLSADFRKLDLEFPWWVEVIGFLSMNVAWLLVRQCLNQFLGALIEEAAETGLDEFLRTNSIRLAFEGVIPGSDTRLLAVAKNITITHDDLVSRGEVRFTAP